MVHNVYSRNICNFFILLIMQLVGSAKIGRYRPCPKYKYFDKESNKCDWDENVDFKGCDGEDTGEGW